MLRVLLGEPPRQNKGLFGLTIDTMVHTSKLLRKEIELHKDPSYDYRKLEIWTKGLISSLDELEQCVYAAHFFRNKVVHVYEQDMTITERGDYARYVFFYKDAFIRVFSALDKSGTFLNELYDLKTSRVKAHFSYFTVLRQFQYFKGYRGLGERLVQIKEKHREVLSILRRRRNTEIHYMNSEMKDDLWQRQQTLYGKIELEDLDQHLYDLDRGFQMVCETFEAIFSYTNRRWREIIAD